jgi:hypothetical protein
LITAMFVVEKWFCFIFCASWSLPEEELSSLKWGGMKTIDKTRAEYFYVFLKIKLAG